MLEERRELVNLAGRIVGEPHVPCGSVAAGEPTCLGATPKG
jgi:hypothetical protein